MLVKIFLNTYIERDPPAYMHANGYGPIKREINTAYTKENFWSNILRIWEWIRFSAQEGELAFHGSMDISPIIADNMRIKTGGCGSGVKMAEE